MNPVLMLTHNCLALTKAAVDSCEHQDIYTPIFIIDNGSTDGTRDWLIERENPGNLYSLLSRNEGVSKGWNSGIDFLFSSEEVSRVLVVNNDVYLPPWFYSELTSYDVPFITGVAVDDMQSILTRPGRMPLTPHPDFSAFLIRRDAWEAIGPFDEQMKHYASDCDYHIRAHRLGIPLYKANVPYYHAGSSTMKQAKGKDREEIGSQADKDREVFHFKWKCLPGTPEYEALFMPEVSRLGSES